jgi:hypothetical protein
MFASSASFIFHVACFVGCIAVRCKLATEMVACRTVRRTCVQAGFSGGVLYLVDGNALFESVTISSPEAIVSTALAAAAPVGGGLGGGVRRRGVPTRRCESAVRRWVMAA